MPKAGSPLSSVNVSSPDGYVSLESLPNGVNESFNGKFRQMQWLKKRTDVRTAIEEFRH
jgi:hypothetical protein